MAIGAIIVTSLSYASQMSVAEYVCNAERFDNKAGPFVGSIMETVRREPISKSCKITQADNLNCRRRLSRKAQ